VGLYVSPHDVVELREERFNNGIHNVYFEFQGAEYRLLQQGWQSFEDQEQTTIKRQEPISSADYNRQMRDWKVDPFRHGVTVAGTLTPMAAAVIIRLAKSEYTRGRGDGYQHAKQELREWLNQ